ncbi:uncharacterized protein LOC142496904 isoform X1 [Ascaphus truei]|uniref:uncharacterized protein LOC142496904 isoform X1 n=1 Tax=Ascaphus truei TaxID=8439 RepID=UPI003F593C1C
MPRKRKDKFSEQEVQTLVNEIMAHVEELFGPTANNVSSDEKNAIWLGVWRKVNKVGGMERGLIDCKKRWSDYKRKLKQRVTEIRSSDSCERLETILTRREMNVVKFFQIDREDFIGNEELSDDANILPWKSAARLFQHQEVGDILLPFHQRDYSINSESDSSVEYEPEDQSISQAKKYQLLKQSFGRRKADGLQASTESTPIASSLQPERFEAKFDQLIALQKDSTEVLKSMQSDFRASLALQRKMIDLLTSNLIENRKSTTASQKMTRDQKNLHLDKMHNKSDKSFQGLQSSDASYEDASSKVFWAPSTSAGRGRGQIGTGGNKRPAAQMSQNMAHQKKKNMFFTPE